MRAIFLKDPAKRYRLMELMLRQKIRKPAERVMRHVLRNVRTNLNGKVLRRRTSTLYRSFSGKISRIPDGYRITIGSPVPYAKIHDTGGMAGRNHATRIPKRNYFRLAFVMSKYKIRNELRRFLAEVFR